MTGFLDRGDLSPLCLLEYVGLCSPTEYVGLSSPTSVNREELVISRKNFGQPEKADVPPSPVDRTVTAPQNV
jgi:hypothetical protein